ncbi:ABC transporter substrate-binding protein [Rhodovibrio salinarum]|uniref:ABC transporter substrate-binding protein n=1 Tax=Rhodovibrio salinarum TaxID=1087 RepID=A0A934QLN8_9PROT|nr:ABC transporter substrate-binding protein [Rhodovibrio salinarum]MBK1699156.1 ABC transporter substrate-binding protein [Rhodovibrio salinarum]
MTDRVPSNWTNKHDRMVEDALRRGASRRELLQMLLAGGIGATVGGTLIGRASRVLAAEPKHGGSLRAAGWSSSTADTLDPAKAQLSTDYVRICSIYNRLTYLNGNSEIEMELAESVESDDAKTWAVKLRSGVTFHDGKPLTAADVVYSFNRHKDDAVGSQVASMAKQMSEITAEDKLNVRIVLSEPNADLPILMSLHHFQIIADGTTDFSTANGTGPFMVEEFEPGVRSILVRNPNYWKENRPYLDSFEFFGIADDSARLNALMSGDVQYVGSLSPRATRLLDSNPQVETLSSTAGNYTNLNMRLDMAPGNDPDFVTGMKYLLNREQTVKSVRRGLGIVANDQPVPPSNRYYNDELKPKPFDPERARHHFDRAGVLGKKITLTASDAANASIDMAVLLQQAGSEIGMNFEVNRVPADGYWSNYWLKDPIHFGNINPRPTPDILFSLLYKSDAPWNESSYQSEKFDRMLIEARGMLDETKRTEIYHEMQRMIAEDAGTAIPAWLSELDGYNTRVRGVEPHPFGNFMGYAFAERVWLDS